MAASCTGIPMNIETDSVASPLVSFIIPCCNEQHNVGELHRRLTATIATLGCRVEILFIDDGSRDGTLGQLLAIRALDDKVRVLEFSRNFGHQAALTAGLENAAGDAVIMMDADLQHPPELIPQLIERWRQGYEIVSTIRNDPPHGSAFKKLTSRCFYAIVNKLTDVHIPPGSADFRLLDRKVVNVLAALGERTRFLRGLVNWVGFRQCLVDYDAAPRHGGVSKYTLFRMINFAFDGITSFSSFPLRISTIFGVIVSIFSFIYAAYAVYIRLFTTQALSGWASVLVSVLFLGGVQLLSLGIIGEYLDRIYTETKGRPGYIISNIHANIENEGGTEKA